MPPGKAVFGKKSSNFPAGLVWNLRSPL